MNDIELYIKWQGDPLQWVCDMFNLRPQGVKEEYQTLYDAAVADRKFYEFKAGWFKPFVKGEEVTWQQTAILMAVGAAGTMVQLLCVSATNWIAWSRVAAGTLSVVQVAAA